MTTFDDNLYQPNEDVIEQDDLIAFHLNELPRQQVRALHRALQTNPALQAESIAIAATLHAFPKHEAALPLDAAALDRHWQALRPSLVSHIPPIAPSRTLFPRSIFQHWGLPALAGSALVTTALVVALHHSRRTSPITVATTHPSTSTVLSIPQATLPNTAPNSNITLTASTQRPWFNNPITNPINNPSSFPPSATPQTALATPSSSLAATELLAPTLPTQVSPATTTNAATATTESPAAKSTSTTSTTSLTQLSKVHPPTIHHPHTSELTLAIFGNLTPDRSSTVGDGGSAPTGTFTQAATPAVGALASFHQQLRPWLGYRIATSYSRPTFEYTDATPDSSGIGIIVNESIYEFSGTYVVQGPRRHRIATSAEAGAGLLAFRPSNPNEYTDESFSRAYYRPTGVVGISAELALTKHWALHAGYRGLVYKAPAYYSTAYGSSLPPAPNNITFTSEPVVGITYRFGANRVD